MAERKTKPVKRDKSVDLVSGIHIRVEGETGKTEGISVGVLAEMGSHLQQLLKLLAKYTLHANFQVNTKDFEIELFDFKPGSAVPAFRFKQMYALSLDDELTQQRMDVSRKFTEVLAISNEGKYERLAHFVDDPLAVSDIAVELFSFRNSVGTSPLSIVKPVARGKFITMYKVARPKRAHTKILLRSSTRRTDNQRPIAYAKVLVNNRPGGRRTAKIKELYTGKDTTMSFAPPDIVAPNRTYHLHSPLMCMLEREEDYHVIQADLYDLYATGSTHEEAETNFYKEFDDSYRHLMSLADQRLSDRLLRAKQAFKLIVKEIVEA